MSLLTLLNRKPIKLKLFVDKYFFLIPLILYLLLSCGLPSYPYLAPPEVEYIRTNPESTSQESDLIFRNAYENNSSIFSGYELYYKIYDPLSEDVDDYNADFTFINSTENASTTTLTSRGFKRLYFTDTYDLPLESHSETMPSFQLPQSLLDENFLTRLKFIQGEPSGSSFNASVYNNDDISFSSSYYIYRWVYNESLSSNEIRYFEPQDFSLYHDDIPDSINVGAAADYYVYISFFILSFGRETDNILNTVYSVPAYLGTLRFECDFTND